MKLCFMTGNIPDDWTLWIIWRNLEELLTRHVVCVQYLGEKHKNIMTIIIVFVIMSAF